jgi:hypothetical protein
VNKELPAYFRAIDIDSEIGRLSSQFGGAPHDVADGNMRRDFHEHMDMFPRQPAGDDLDAAFLAHLPDNHSYPLPQRAFQHVVD